MTNAEALYVVSQWSRRYEPTDLVQLVHDAISYQAKKAGKISSARKRQAVRLNGQKGGRKKR